MTPNQVVHIEGDGNYRFDMTTVHRYEGNCGTAGCILGLAELLEKVAGRPETWNDSNYRNDQVKPNGY